MTHGSSPTDPFAISGLTLHWSTSVHLVVVVVENFDVPMCDSSMETENYGLRNQPAKPNVIYSRNFRCTNAEKEAKGFNYPKINHSVPHVNFQISVRMPANMIKVGIAVDSILTCNFFALFILTCCFLTKV